jgi:type VII secretion-associated serine protease mycosin
MRARSFLAALLLCGPALVGVGAGPAAALPGDCSVQGGGPPSATLWAQQRLKFQQVWPVTRGQGVLVAVIDSGLDTQNPQLRTLRPLPGRDVIDQPGFPVDSTRDCKGHGTEVTSIIAALPSPGSSFLGMAPGVTILPIKQTNTDGDQTGTWEGIARGIDAAVAAHARVVNISVTSPNTGPQLADAVQRAAAAGLVIVAAAGNDGAGNDLPAYPAAYSTRFPNVIAVSATDAADQVADFSQTGAYVTVAAPGVGVEVPAPITGYVRVDGTSFAAPCVTATVALMLAAHPGMTPIQVRNRLEATADPPPATVPDRKYGYGIVNPYLAVTSVRSDSPVASSSAVGPPVPARAAPAPPDRHLQHVALGAALALVGLAAIVIAGAAVLRQPAPGRRRVAS